MRYIIFFFFLFLNTFLQAQENLDSLLKTAAENNPGLIAKYDLYLASLQKVPQAGSLPDPEITFGYFIKPMELIGGNQIGQIQAMQMFPWFGSRKVAKSEASKMAAGEFEKFRSERDNLFYNIRNTYYQLYLTKKEIQVNDSTLLLLKSIENLLMTKFKSSDIKGSTTPNYQNYQQQGKNQSNGNGGMGMKKGNKNVQGNQGMNQMGNNSSGSAFGDLIRLRIEIDDLVNNLGNLKARQKFLNIQINLLLNRKEDIPVFVPDSIPLPAIDYKNPGWVDSIRLNNPMILMNQSEVFAYQSQQRMNRKMGYPMIGIGANYMVISKSEMSTSDMNGKDMIMPMVTVKLPIYRKKYHASVKEAQLLENSAQENLKESQNMVYLDYTENLLAVNDADRKLLYYRDVISLTQKDFELQMNQYTSSGTNFEGLIRIHRQLLDYRLSYFRAKVDKLMAIAGIQKLLSENFLVTY